MGSGLPNAVFPTLRRPGLGSRSNPDGKLLVAKTQTQSLSDIIGLTCIEPRFSHALTGFPPNSAVLGKALLHLSSGLASSFIYELYGFSVCILVDVVHGCWP